MAIKKKTTASTIQDLKICSSCGMEKKMSEYYYSSSYANRSTKTVPLCKSCIYEYVKPEYKNIYDMIRVKEILRMIDKPFIQKIWLASVEESESKGGVREYFGLYMKNIAMKDFRECTWDNSEFEISEEDSEKTKSNKVKYAEPEFTKDELEQWKRMWGEQQIKDYMFLEEFYGDYINNFPTDTPAQVNIYKNLAKIHLQAEKALEEGRIKEYKDLMELSSKMHNDANIKPIQSSGANDDKGVSTYGLWIKEIESTEPCEYFEGKPQYQDYDGFQKYIEKWLLRPMKNIFGMSKDFDVGDDK